MLQGISNYQDYRIFIRDWISGQRNIDKKFSLIYYSRKIKASDSYLKQVVNYKRNLNLDKAYLLTKAFDLTPSEKLYFITLVLENECQEPSLKRFFRSQLLEFSHEQFTYSKNIKLSSIFENNILWEIFSLIGLNEFVNDPFWIQKRLYFDTSIKEIQKAIDILLSLGAIENKNGKFTANNIIIPHKFNPVNAYIVALKRAIQFLQKGLKENAAYDSFCLILSPEQYEQIKSILEDTKRKVAKVASNKSESKTLIAYLNLNLFQASK